MVDPELLAEGQIEAVSNAALIEMSSERCVDRDVVEAGFARPVVRARPVGGDGHADGERRQSVIEPVMEVVGVEHDQHVGVDVVDASAHGRESVGHERLRMGRTVTR